MPVKTPRTPHSNGKDARRPAAARHGLVRALIDGSEHGVLVLDARGRVTDLNAAAARLMGVSVDGARGRPASGILRTVLPDDDPAAEALREPRVEREIVLASRTGGETPVLLLSVRLGTPAGALVTLRDLTRSRRMQEELRRNERLATLGQLSAGVAHEIRNPLAGIGTSAQVLLRRFEPRDERTRFVKVILEEVERLDRIVTSLLQYARPRTPELQAVRLEDCVRKVHELSAEPARQSGIEIEVSIGPRLGPLHLDADLIVQVLLNVSLNAIQAMPKGGVLRYEVRRMRRRAPARGPGRRAEDRPVPQRGPGAWLEFQQVRVSDTGVGMSRGTLAKLFHPFFSTKPRGTGLGMAISQTIVQEHGGTIEVVSREGRGTTVLINFPTEKRHGERRHAHEDPSRAHAPRR